MTTAVTKTEKVPAYLKQIGTAAETTPLTPEEIVFPQLKLVQGVSDVFLDGNAEIGQIINSADNAVLAAKDGRLRIHPFHFHRAWSLFEVQKGKKPDYAGMDFFTEGSETLPLNYTKDDKNYERIYTLIVYAVVANVDLPMMIIFRSSGMFCGRRLVTLMYVENAVAKLPPYARPVEIFAKTKKGPSGAYFVLDFKVCPEFVTEKTGQLCQQWLESFSLKG